MRRKIAALLGLAAAALAAPALSQSPSQMTTGVQPPPPPPSAPPRLQDLTPAQQQEYLRALEEARRTAGRRTLSMDCRPEQPEKPMTDLERETWRLKCGDRR